VSLWSGCEGGLGGKRPWREDVWREEALAGSGRGGKRPWREEALAGSARD
jgi:hypothetical protein